VQLLDKVLSPFAAATSFTPIGTHAYHAPIEILVVECGYGGSCLMAFHVEGCKTFALSREEIFYQFKGVYGAVFRKEGGE
jgi:hypothetical protein